ncbi:MAG TPA: hypothetical protein VMZ28_16345 [Kofleriaceae bacterium]|nr:hypothetical protein [Kofleriaceae bacterium]
MDAEHKDKVKRATDDLLRAIRELNRARADKKRQRTLLAETAPQRFLQAIEAFAEAIGT